MPDPAIRARDLSKPYNGQIASIQIAGIVGPRGDAYALNRTITSSEAEDYHGIQMGTLKAAKVDIVWAATFNWKQRGCRVAFAATSRRR